jgi:tetratricopeptide (TPR) repeat protein
MTRRDTLKFLILIVVAGGLILGSLMQLLGSVWFHRAKAVREGRIMYVKAMEKACAFQTSHSFYRFSIGEAFWEESKTRDLTPIDRWKILVEARTHLKRAVLLEPTASLYHHRLGRVFAALGVYEHAFKKRADRAFDRAFFLNPTHLDLRWDVANYYLREYDLSRKWDTKSQPKLDTESSRARFLHHFRALLEMQSPRGLKRILERCFEVMKDYNDVKRVVPDRPGYHLEFARFLSQKKIWEAAQKEFEIAIFQDPTNPEAYHAYGKALFVHGEHEKALVMWEQEQTLNQESPRSYLARANAFWTLDRKDDAVKELEQLVVIHPEETSYRLVLARRLEGAGLPKKALRTYREALERDSKNERIYVQLASYWTRQRNMSEAEAALLRAISLKPEEVAYRQQLAQLYFSQKRYARAIEEWQGILSSNPHSVGALLGIAGSYERLEVWNRALRYYKDASTLKPDDPSILQKFDSFVNILLID